MYIIVSEVFYWGWRHGGFHTRREVRSETQFDDSVDTYAPQVYDKAKEIFESMVADGNDGEKSVWSLTEGRRATVENAKKAADMGVDMIVLTGNPGVGVDNRAITKALADLNEAVGDRVILTAGKMHASGILSEAGEKILTKEDAETFIEAGADVLLLPAPGTVPGFAMEHAAELIKSAHEKGVLAMTTIGTSQEGADEATIRQIALMCKMAGADIHHIGDSGYMGMALPENITAYSVAIRGKRHTYRRNANEKLRETRGGGTIRKTMEQIVLEGQVAKCPRFIMKNLFRILNLFVLQ